MAAIPIPYEDEPIEKHTKERPFCSDPKCPDKEDQKAIGIVGQHVEDGLMTNEEADQLYWGRTI